MERHAAIARWLAKCESEPERSFSLAVLLGDGFDFRPADDESFVDGRGLHFAQKIRVRPSVGRLVVVDLAFTNARLAIEIDGGIWHDGADAVQHDRERDRRLLVAGWRTVRFSENEIAMDALSCARDAIEIARLNGSPRQEQLAFAT